jgi:hypothetical protein
MPYKLDEAAAIPVQDYARSTLHAAAVEGCSGGPSCKSNASKESNVSEVKTVPGSLQVDADTATSPPTDDH